MNVARDVDERIWDSCAPLVVPSPVSCRQSAFDGAFLLPRAVRERWRMATRTFTGTSRIVM